MNVEIKPERIEVTSTKIEGFITRNGSLRSVFSLVKLSDRWIVSSSMCSPSDIKEAKKIAECEVACFAELDKILADGHWDGGRWVEKEIAYDNFQSTKNKIKLVADVRNGVSEVEYHLDDVVIMHQYDFFYSLGKDLHGVIGCEADPEVTAKIDKDYGITHLL